jgi:hypothetical protein
MAIKVWQVCDEAELASLYATSDYGLSRTSSDSLRAFGTAMALGLTDSQVNKLVRATKYLLAGWPRSGIRHKLAPERTHELALEWGPTFKAVLTLIAGGHETVRNRLITQGPLSVLLGLVRFSEDKEAANHFVKLASEGLGESDGPSKALHYYLVESKFRQNVDPMRQRLGSPITLAIATAYTWNKHYKGQTLEKLTDRTALKARRLPIETTDLVIDTTRARGQTIDHDLWYQITGLKDRRAEEDT